MGEGEKEGDCVKSWEAVSAVMYGKCTAPLVAPLGGLRAAYSAKLMIPLVLT